MFFVIFMHAKKTVDWVFLQSQSDCNTVLHITTLASNMFLK